MYSPEHIWEIYNPWSINEYQQCIKCGVRMSTGYMMECPFWVFEHYYKSFNKAKLSMCHEFLLK